MIKWIKYVAIIMLATVSNKTVVTFFGTTYIVSGNIVKKFGG